MSSVLLEKVSKVYPNGTVAVEDISLEIKSQELLILVGPSGCGKTTTLRMIAGLENTSSGNIFINDQKVNHLSPQKRNVAMVFQNYALYPHMTVYNNLAFALKMQKIPRTVIKQRVEEISSLLGIKDILKSKPRFLSGGQQQRIALGRAIIRYPDLFLFDEPLSNLDTHLRAKMRTELSRLHTRLNTTMIYVTHDQLEAMSMGDRIAVLNNGRIQQITDPVAIYENPANKFVAGFFGSPPINFFEGKIIDYKDRLCFSSKGLNIPVPLVKINALSKYKNKKVFMGIRPEHIFLKSTHSDSIVTAFIEVIEHMGVETLVYFGTGEHDFVVRFDSNKQFEVGENVSLFFDMDKSLFFDYNTETTI